MWTANVASGRQISSPGNIARQPSFPFDIKTLAIIDLQGKYSVEQTIWHELYPEGALAPAVSCLISSSPMFFSIFVLFFQHWAPDCLCTLDI